MTRHLKRLLDHLVWADLRVLEALRAATMSQPHAVALYAHVLGAERVWLDRLLRQPASMSVWPELELEACAVLGAETHAAYRTYLAGLSDADLFAQVPYVNSLGDSFTTSVEEILLHVCLHGTYHRGQIAILLRAEGAQPAATDFIALVRGAPAATRTVDPRD